MKVLYIYLLHLKHFLLSFDLKRYSVFALYLVENSSIIANVLQHLKVNKMFVHRTINRYTDAGVYKNATVMVTKNSYYTRNGSQNEDSN